MSGLLANLTGYPQKNSGLGRRWIPQDMMDMITLLWINISTPRGIYGLSLGSACGGSIGVSNRTT